MKFYSLSLLIIIISNFSLSQVTTTDELKKLKKPELIWVQFRADELEMK